MTGASLLTKSGAWRVGAGLVTIAAPPDTWVFYASDQSVNLIEKTTNLNKSEQQITDPRITSIIIGPGLDVSNKTKEFGLSTF